MTSILEKYREIRDAARVELRALRAEIQQVITAEDLTWREKIGVCNDAWSGSIKATLARAVPHIHPGMHPSIWEAGVTANEDRIKFQCMRFIAAMDDILDKFPASSVPKGKRSSRYKTPQKGSIKLPSGQTGKSTLPYIDPES